MATELKQPVLMVLRAAWMKDMGLDFGTVLPWLNYLPRMWAMRYTVEAVTNTWWLWFCKRVPCGTLNARC